MAKAKPEPLVLKPPVSGNPKVDKGEISVKTNRYKVVIRCRQCGERFILRGRMTKEGKVETGFRQCLCDNDSDFDIRIEEL
ncbi:MAG: hypothetical protein L5657_06915 [Calditerricola sp.]|nr:hypothetical protein [Calditerricola sp.]